MSHALQSVAQRIAELAVRHAEQGVPGFVAGVYQGGEQVVVAHGTANLATGAPMTADTGFLFGSITKVLTATLIMQQVERGTLGLDDLVVDHLPEFRLATDGAAERIRVRHLLTHTNGIDADLYCPDANGPGALSVLVDGMAKHCEALFEPGTQVSYSNGGMNLAARLLEVVTGTPYLELVQRDIFAPAGMTGAGTSAEQAILRSTAVGHFLDPETTAPRVTDMFKLPDSWAGAGSSATGTVGDLLAFGRTHLAEGVAPSGARLLAAESAAAMHAVQFDPGAAHIPLLGFGWLLMPFGDTTVWTMSGASPGGVSVLVVVPEHDLVLAAYGNSPGSLMLHDEVLLGILRDHLGVDVPDLVSGSYPIADLTPYVGTYRSNQLCVDVAIVDGQLEERFGYEPVNAEQERIFTNFAGGSFQAPPRRYVPVGPDLFAPAGMPASLFSGYCRQLLVSYLEVGPDGARFRSAGGRMTRRAQQ
ncbi:serine hydrolase domain-containing protein [Nocardia stercoris]|uniref:Class A beta-lactamase-related serine hydrolase n=1 Tax=Nocardia stercoris TaxID=2483361 RepID=A0A3M2L3J9_9NOCA|nr:serine hydrolase domain-containing protein [Nocardia stercoris]RMI32282.1 class A beta-lactamase-related serine hydrolase [Nocardia stercoris]